MQHSIRISLLSRLEAKAAVSKFREEVKILAEKQGEKQVMDILSEAKDGKNVHEIVRKAKRMLLVGYSTKTSLRHADIGDAVSQTELREICENTQHITSV